MPLILFVTFCLRVFASQDSADRNAGWRSDLQFLLTEVRRLHASPARPAYSPQFQEAITRLADRVPRLTDAAMVVQVQRLMAMLGDGHSLVYLVPARRAPLTMLPFDLYWFSDGLFVVGGQGEAAQWTGSRVLSIGGKTPEELLPQLEPYVSRDNAMALKAVGAFYLTVPAFLETWGAAAEGQPVRFALSDRQGHRRDVTLNSGSLRRPRKLAPPPGATRPTPMYLERVGTAYWARSLPQRQAVYVQFNQVMNAEEESLAAFVERLRVMASAPEVRNLIVDVRHNNGGNNMLLAPLVELLATFQRSAPDHRIYVITSRSTFSAAQNFINRVERSTHAVFVGEPSLSSPNFTGEDHEVVLPYSGGRVSISNRYWQDSSPDDRRPWIAPAIP